MKAMRDCTGKPVEDLGAKNLVLKGPLGTTYAATTVAPVQKNLLSVAAMVDAGNEVVFRKDGSYIQNVKTGRWHSLRRLRRAPPQDSSRATSRRTRCSACSAAPVLSPAPWTSW